MKKIFILTGEPSGDKLASEVIKELQKSKKCNKVLFAGNIIKPRISKLKLDLKGFYYIPRIIKASKLGDAAILKELIKILYDLAVVDKKLENKQFLDNAPHDVIEKQRAIREELSNQKNELEISKEKFMKLG